MISSQNPAMDAERVQIWRGQVDTPSFEAASARSGQRFRFGSFSKGGGGGGEIGAAGKNEGDFHCTGF